MLSGSSNSTNTNVHAEICNSYKMTLMIINNTPGPLFPNTETAKGGSW